MDPRNSGLLNKLAWNYRFRRHYRDAERILDRLVELESNQPKTPLGARSRATGVARLRTANRAICPEIRRAHSGRGEESTCPQFGRNRDGSPS